MKHLKCFATFLMAFFYINAAISQVNLSDQKVREIQSATLKTVLSPFLQNALIGFSAKRYEQIKPLIFEKSIPEIQKSVHVGKFSYLELTQFFLYRIAKFEMNAESSLHAIMALNPDIIKEAKEKDAQLRNRSAKHEIFGMPILLKDNIGSKKMNTTAGALAMIGNQADDAFVVKQLKAKGALILGRVNLSEWAYYMCSSCPPGYSAVGGYTLNPYGPGVFDTGGSSSGSAVAVAANYAVAAIGTETAGSILSPSGQNAVVGLKPTVGLLSRTGIIPISSTFDTPGPMTKNVVDNAIILSAMLGKDEADPASVKMESNYSKGLATSSLKGKRFGVISSYLVDSLYAKAIAKIKDAGAVLVEIKPLPVFTLMGNLLKILNYDFKNDLSYYLKNYASKNVEIKSVSDLVKFNADNASLRIPYGQALLEGVAKDTTSLSEITTIKNKSTMDSRHALEKLFDENRLDAILSINNYNAAEAAVAKYPALAMPMGCSVKGEPKALTFIAKPFEEHQLLSFAAAFERLALPRKIPPHYN